MRDFTAGFRAQVTSVNDCAIRTAKDFIADPAALPYPARVAEDRS